jgi:hypothetical protein
MQVSTVDVVFYSSQKQSRGHATLSTVPREVALRNGIVLWLACWGVAIITLPIPIVHFIAPPLLILLGPPLGIGVYKLYNGATDITGGGGLCPDCGANVSFYKRAARWPADMTCPSCQARLTARPPDDA